MKAKILVSTLGLKLKDTHLPTGYNSALSQIQSWERDFGIGSSCPFDQDLRFVFKGVILGNILKTLNSLESAGYISIDRDYSHYRLEMIKDDSEWIKLDKRIKRLAAKGHINIIPYKNGRLYPVHEECPYVFPKLNPSTIKL